MENINVGPNPTRSTPTSPASARRVAWIVSERRAHPGSVLAITFTNKAAAEMKERVEELVGRRARLMWVSTFHSACVRILRKEIERLGYGRTFSIYDAADQKRLMTLVANDLVDQYRLLVFPTVLGKGRKLFDATDAPLDLRLAVSEDVGGGVLRQIYDRQ